MECICGSKRIITKTQGKYYITYCSQCGLSNYGINCSAIVSEETWKQKVEEIRKNQCDNCLFSTRKEKVDEAYQKGRADAINECIKVVKSVGADEYSYNEMLRQMKQLNEQK